MSTAAQLFMTLNRLATVAEAPDEATRRNGISRDEFLSLLGIKTSAPGAALSEASERAFERAKQTLRDAGARITHFTTDTSGRYRLNAEAPDSLTAWNPTAEEFRLLNAELRGWEGTELQDEAYRILRKIALTSKHLTDEALTAANVTRIEEIKRDNQPPLIKTVKQRARDLHAYREHIQRLHFSDDPHLYELFTAYAQRKTLNFIYQGSGGDIKTYEKVSVAGLIYSYGSWYLVAHFPLGNKTPEERKTYTYRTDRIRSLDVFSSTDPAPINPAYEARTRLKKISGYEETLAVLDPNPGTGDPAAPFTVPSYGAVDSAIDATCAGWLIQPRHNTGNSASGASVTGRQQDSHAAQQELLRDLIALHTGEPETPTKWFPTTQRSRNDALDDLDDLILALHRADRWADVHDEAPMPLNKLNPLYRVDNDNAAKLDKIINAIYDDFDEVPFYSEAKNPDAPTPARTNLLPEFGDGAASLTLLNYARPASPIPSWPSSSSRSPQPTSCTPATRDRPRFSPRSRKPTRAPPTARSTCSSRPRTPCCRMRAPPSPADAPSPSPTAPAMRNASSTRWRSPCTVTASTCTRGAAPARHATSLRCLSALPLRT